MNVSIVWAALASLDAGTSLADASAHVSAEDQEIIDNLELLQNLENMNDFDLLRDLTVER